MRSLMRSVSVLLVSFGILALGHGLSNTLLAVRATLEHYPSWVIGLMMSGYFIGFIFGTLLSTRLIPRVGHIRTFAAFACLASIISLLHGLYVNELTWILLRILYGMCLASLYMIIESWLNGLSSRKNRGRVLSIYMTINFFCLAMGQLLLLLSEPTTYVLFALVSILISLSVIPLMISSAKQPVIAPTERFGILRLFRIAPLATIGCFSTGLAMGAFWGMGAVYFTLIGLPSQQVALAIAATFLGGFIFQWPIGYLSDRFDRRLVILFMLFFVILVGIQIIFLINEGVSEINLTMFVLLLLFGGFGYTLYSMFVAHANDSIDPRFCVKTSAGLIFSHAVGAVFGPFLGSLAMVIGKADGLFIYISSIFLIVLVITSIQILRRQVKR